MFCTTVGGLACSRVAKARVQPSVMLQLQNQVQAFRQLAAQTVIKESCWQNKDYTQLVHTQTHTHISAHVVLLVLIGVAYSKQGTIRCFF